MADSRQIEIQALWDGTRLKTGTEQAETSVEALARAVDDSSDSMRRSLQSIDDGVSSTLGPGGTFDRSVDDVETSGSRMKDVGSEIGSEFAENIGEGIRSGDIGGTILETFTSLGPALGVVGIGIAVGAGLINGMIRGAKEARAEFLAAVNGIFEQTEIRARTTNERIRKEILEAFTFESVLTELGGDEGVAGGVKKVDWLVKNLGVDFNEVVEILRGDLNPANRDTLAILQRQADIGPRLVSSGKAVAIAENVAASNAREVLDALERTRAVQRDSQHLAERNRDYIADQADQAGRLADNSERAAAASRRMADAYREAAIVRLPDNLW